MQYMLIHAHTGTYMHAPITVGRGLWGAVADAVCLRERRNFPNRLGWGLGPGRQARIWPGTARPPRCDLCAALLAHACVLFFSSARSESGSRTGQTATTVNTGNIAEFRTILSRGACFLSRRLSDTDSILL